MLAGLNLPISEDLLIIVSGVLASSVVPENTWKLFTAVFLGAYLSDWIVYWLGRWLGPNLQKVKWFANFFRKERVQKIEAYYKKYGALTLLVGRFIPFGVRNCLFVTAGLGKMHFGKFALFDGIACILSNTVLFTLAYYCGKNFTGLYGYVNIALFATFVVALIGFIWYKKRKAQSKC